MAPNIEQNFSKSSGDFLYSMYLMCSDEENETSNRNYPSPN